MPKTCEHRQEHTKQWTVNHGFGGEAFSYRRAEILLPRLGKFRVFSFPNIFFSFLFFFFFYTPVCPRSGWSNLVLQHLWFQARTINGSQFNHPEKSKKIKIRIGGDREWSRQRGQYGKVDPEPPSHRMIEEPVVDAVQRDWMRSYNSSGVAQLMVDVLLPDRRKVQYDTVKRQALVVSLPCLDQALIRA